MSAPPYSNARTFFLKTLEKMQKDLEEYKLQPAAKERYVEKQSSIINVLQVYFNTVEEIMQGKRELVADAEITLPPAVEYTTKPIARMISCYRNVGDTSGDKVKIVAVLNAIHTGKFKSEIEKLRSTTEKELRDELKKNLPAVTFSGSFEKRSAKNLLEYTGLMCLDIDSLGDSTQDVKNTLIQDAYVFCCFISPSGTGLKVIVRTDAHPSQHLVLFKEIESYFENRYQLKLDASGKDVCRLCFVSYDAELYLNEEAKTFYIYQKSFLKVVDFTNKKATYIEGNRNNYLFLLANNCNRAGIPETVAGEFIHQSFDLSEKEMTDCIKHAYKNTHEFGKSLIQQP